MAKFFVDLLVKIKVLPHHISILMERFMCHIEDCVEMDNKLMHVSPSTSGRTTAPSVFVETVLHVSAAGLWEGHEPKKIRTA